MSWLPRFSATTPNPSESTPPPTLAPLPADGAVILLVEDEPAVRGLFASALRKDGFYVLEASNGAEALTVVEQAGRVDLVVTDVVMPIMKGTELADRLRQKYASLRFIFVSGYAIHEALGPNAELLQKPFVKQDLVRRVVAVLGPAPGRPS